MANSFDKVSLWWEISPFKLIVIIQYVHLFSNGHVLTAMGRF